MRKIDYGDINKFLVSIGLVLIGIAIIAPYFYLKEDFGLHLEQEALKKLQAPIQNIIKDKQNQVLIIHKSLPWAALIIFILGVASSTIGLIRWFKRQAKIDEKFDKELQKLDLELESLTPEEKEEKAKKEVEEIELEEQASFAKTVTKPTTAKQAFIDYMKVEQDITHIFEKYDSPNFKVLSQQRLGNKFEVDLLLRANSKKYSDRIVELKYFKNQVPLSLINRTLHQLNTYLSYYKKTTNKHVIPVLIVIFNEENLPYEQIERIQERIRHYSNDIPNLKRLKIEFIPIDKINQFDVRKILRR